MGRSFDFRRAASRTYALGGIAVAITLANEYALKYQMATAINSVQLFGLLMVPVIGYFIYSGFQRD